MIKIPTILAGAAALSLASTSFAQIGSYSEDFEGMNQANPTELGDNGWLVFGNVFDPGGGYLYGYGPFPAPNGGPGFCAIASGQGGAPQGNQQIVTYSDYNNGDHGAGNLIEANIFQERMVHASDVGKTFTFTFDAKLGDIFAPSTSSAFIKVIDSAVFSLDGFASTDTTNMPVTWSTFSLSLLITNDHIGDFFQVGFSNVSTNFDNTGQYYDNLSISDDGGGCATSVYCEGPSQNGDIAIDNCVLDGSGNTITVTNSTGTLFAYFLIGNGSGVVSNPPGANGDLCLGGSTPGTGRYVADLQSPGGSGTFSTDIYNGNTGAGAGSLPNPPGGTLMPGDTWNFQAWNRMPGGNPSTFTKALTVTFK